MWLERAPAAPGLGPTLACASLLVVQLGSPLPGFQEGAYPRPIHDRWRARRDANRAVVAYHQGLDATEVGETLGRPRP